jgi:hypothetical protein
MSAPLTPGTPGTPGSIFDPNDDMLYYAFINSLQQPAISTGNNSPINIDFDQNQQHQRTNYEAIADSHPPINVKQQMNPRSLSKKFHISNLIDNHDDDLDPDFTFTETNDLDDADLDWLVPSNI